MKKIYTPLLVAITLYACTMPDKTERTVTNKEFNISAPAIGDSFVLSVRLPADYEKSTSRYPVVFLTDANFHFPMLAATVNQYEKTGLLPPLILIGIGYSSFELMDSLRVRDYLYPASISSDEMTAPGGGKNFYSFITSRLIPFIDSSYRTDTTNRTLLGHSFGGYFTLYTLLNQLENKRTDFTTFVSASPTLWYNNFYLNQLTDKLTLRTSAGVCNIFMSVGGQEDSTWGIAPANALANHITNAGVKNVHLQYNLYSNLEHMDVAQLTFIKGLQAFIKP